MIMTHCTCCIRLFSPTDCFCSYLLKILKSNNALSDNDYSNMLWTQDTCVDWKKGVGYMHGLLAAGEFLTKTRPSWQISGFANLHVCMYTFFMLLHGFTRFCKVKMKFPNLVRKTFNVIYIINNLMLHDYLSFSFFK